MAKSKKAAAPARGATGSGRATASASRTASKTTKKAATKTASKSATRGAATTKRAASSSKPNNEETKLRELFVEELKDIYWAEKHLTKALPKMAKAATSEELRMAFEQHLVVTQEQIARVEEVFEMLGMPAKAKKCDAMEGLVREAQSAIEDTDKGTSTRDAALIISAQKVEHYEIASYGSLAQLAKTMGMEEIGNLLGQTLQEEKQTDELLTELAISSINIHAEEESE